LSWTSARTWVTGELITAAICNSAIRDNMNVLNPGGLTAIMDNSGAAFAGGTGCSSGSSIGFEMPVAGSLQTATLITDNASDIEIQLWKDTFANYPPASPDNITGNSPLRTLSLRTLQVTALTTWTCCFAAGDWIVPRIIGCSGPTKVFMALRWNRT